MYKIQARAKPPTTFVTEKDGQTWNKELEGQVSNMLVEVCLKQVQSTSARGERFSLTRNRLPVGDAQLQPRRTMKDTRCESINVVVVML